MSLLDLGDKKDWTDFASKECIALDSNGFIDAKETQVRLQEVYCIFSCDSADDVFTAASKACQAGGHRGK
jgi:hypothetical protein